MRAGEGAHVLLATRQQEGHLGSSHQLRGISENKGPADMLLNPYFPFLLTPDPPQIEK